MNTLIKPNMALTFPDRNENIRAEWMPVYIEPMVGSGERICIGIATANDAGFLVVPVVALNRLECVYGKDVQAILFAADFVANNLREALTRGGKAILHSWVPPMEGVYKGRVVNSAGSSLEEIARTGLVTCASLVERLAEADEDGTSSTDDKLSGNRLERLIKDKVLSAHPELEPMFAWQRIYGENIRSVTIGFVGKTIAANFGILTPQKLSVNVKDIKAKLWDLAQLRDDVLQNLLLSSTLNRFEMLVHKTADDSPEYSDKQIKNVNEAANELEAEADKKEIRCKAFNGHEAMADILIKAEAA